MNVLIIVILIVLGIQVTIFVMTRRKIKKERANNILEKYQIKTAGDAWRIINNPDIPEADRHKIEALYSKDENKEGT